MPQALLFSPPRITGNQAVTELCFTSAAILCILPPLTIATLPIVYRGHAHCRIRCTFAAHLPAAAVGRGVLDPDLFVHRHGLLCN